MLDFLCIGAQKAGTTWLNGNLRRHPAVWTPPFAKEVQFFDNLHTEDRAGRFKIMRRRAKRIMEKKPDMRSYLKKVIDPSFAFTEDWYRHIFSIAPEGVVKGEMTPVYSALDEDSVEYVKRLMPDAKIIYLIRDPFDRAKSSLHMNLSRKKEPDSEVMLKILRDPMFQQRGKYSGNIPLWDKAFPAEQILYVPFGRIKTDPAGVMRDVESHLGLAPHSGYPKLTQKVNSAKKSVELTDEVLAMIREMTASEYPYLKQRFGEQFCSQIK